MAGAKEGEVYVVPADGAEPGWGISGVFCRDTILFDRWQWTVAGAQRLSRNASGNRIVEHHALTDTDRSQKIGLHRELTVHAGGFQDRWTFTSTTAEPQVVNLELDANPRMVDIFAARLAPDDGVPLHVERRSANDWMISRTAADGIVDRATVRCASGLPDPLAWKFDLAPREVAELTIEVEIARSDHAADVCFSLPEYDSWRASFSDLARVDAAVGQAIDDLRALLLPTEYGPYPAAGMPIFVNFFGRDALITGMMVLPWRPDLLRATLAFLAARQGTTTDPFREEEPGKILHEIRRGELSRTGRIPFGRYYGSIDATPLFLIAAGEYQACDDDGLIASLGPAIAAATDWLVDHLDGPSGLATFEASGSGLAVQSWKDSANSMVDEHGQCARQPLAVAEVQGYAYAALRAAARLIPDRAEALDRRADELQQAFHAQFWLPDLATYAMALDRDMAPLRVLSSDPGHLLWAGIVPAHVAPALVATLMGPELWSGWGLRTLGAGEAAYNPVSYHNGSVWPHDTAIFVMGLARYGFTRERDLVAAAVIDLAAGSPGRQAPELVSGFARDDHPAPISYTHANAPQAWSAAAVIRMAAYLSASQHSDPGTGVAE